MFVRRFVVGTLFVVSIASSIATSESESPDSTAPPPVPAFVEFDAVQLDTTTSSGPGFGNLAGASIGLFTTAQPGADTVASSVQLELFPAGGVWPADVDIHVSDTRTTRVWDVTAGAGTGPVFLEIDNAYENCFGQGFVPSCDSGFEAVLTGPSGLEVVWDARLTGPSELGGYQPALIGQVD